MTVEAEQEDNEHESEKTGVQLKAAALKPGARVGLFAPSGRPENPLVLRRCMQTVEAMGFSPVPGASVLRYDGFSAGTDEERLEDIQVFLQDNSIEALVCISGGYGAIRLLPLLDFSEIRKHPKIFLGCGDNDAMLLAINKLTGLVVFHGPNLDEVNDLLSFNSVKRTLAGDELRSINCRDADDAPYEFAAYSLSDKVCEGLLCGGSLSALASLFGTPYQPDLDGKILALNDMGERSSILDRWFTTLYLAGTLDRVSGIAFGAFHACGSKGADNMLSVEDTFGDRLKETGTAACFGFKFGLPAGDNVLPLGIRASLDCGEGRLQFLESAYA